MEVPVSPPGESRLTRRQRDMIHSALYHLLVGGFALVMLYPILWMIGSSLKGPSEIWTNVTSLIPREVVWENYPVGWRGFGGISFATYFKNSFIIAVTSTLFVVASSAIVAFGFARIRFAGRTLWFTLMILTLMLPGQVLLIPQYILFNELGWVNSFMPLIVPKLTGAPFFIFLLMQFVRGIPLELDQAAQMDGASRFGIFSRIHLPLMQPALITCAIFSFYWTWDDFLAPLIYLNDPRLYTVSLALRSMADPSGATNWGAIFAMSTLSLIPVFLLFIFFQRYLVEGIATTGMKG